MAIATTSHNTDDRCHLHVSRYDKVSSLLISLLILIGLLVLILFTAWFTSKYWPIPKAKPIAISEADDGDGDPGGGQTPEPPNPEEIREMEIEEPIITETLTTISAVVKRAVPQLDDPMIAHKKTTGMGFGHGEGRGRGDGKGDGTGGGGLRWQVRFDKGATLDEYAKQLDYFHIELGVLMPNNQLAYVSNFTRRKPTVRRVPNPGKDEERYYLTWRRGPLQKADLELLARAGVDAKNCIIVKFMPQDLVQKLIQMEKNYAGRKRDEIRRTRFGISSSGSGYKFFVLDQAPK